jgi:hypothetical protein
MMTPNSKIVEAPKVEPEIVPEVLRINMTTDKQNIDCEPDQKITLKINVTNNGTAISPALTLRHQYKIENN